MFSCSPTMFSPYRNDSVQFWLLRFRTNGLLKRKFVQFNSAFCSRVQCDQSRSTRNSHTYTLYRWWHWSILGTTNEVNQKFKMKLYVTKWSREGQGEALNMYAVEGNFLSHSDSDYSVLFILFLVQMVDIKKKSFNCWRECKTCHPMLKCITYKAI